MIDAHCHLEQKYYDKDRDEVVERCRRGLRAVVTSCAHPDDFELTMRLADKYPNFVFATASIHPIHIREIDEKQKSEFFELIRANRSKLVGIGETGLDFEIEEEEFREKQKEMFAESVELSKMLQLPLVIHARDAFAETVEILEERAAERVLMHFFSAKELLERVVDNGWYVSVNTALLRSKKIKKIVRDAPLERILTETDAPWLALGEDGAIKEPGERRNEPTAVRAVTEKIAEIKKLEFGEVDAATTKNAIEFFRLKI
jgi:TatD DNase family protein